MKVKVITYANDGNTVINKYMELTAVNYHSSVFTGPIEEFDRAELVYKFDEVYYNEGNYYFEQIINNTEKVINHYNNYLATLHTQKWIKNIYITLFEALNMDTKQLLENRERQIREREEKKQAEIKYKAEQVEIALQKRLNELKEAKLKLAAGEKIGKDDFIELVKMYKIPMHIRTIGMLNDLNRAEIGINQAYISGKKGKAFNLDKVFEAAQLLAAC